MISAQHNPLTFNSEILGYFGDLFTYPNEGYIASAEKLYDLLPEKVRSSFNLFMNYVQGKDISDLQASYTGLFEMNFFIAPYIGYHLFGESYLRSMFLVGLAERYAKYDFEPSGELHDHISVILKFMSTHPSSDLTRELLEDALIPTLQRILWNKVSEEDRPDDPTASLVYYELLNCLLVYLTGSPQDDIFQLDVKDAVLKEEKSVDAWIRKGKRKEEKL